MNTMLSKIIKPNKKIIGLDVGTSSVKIMEIEGESLEDAKLIAYAIEPIPKDISSEDGHVESVEALGEVIARCWKKSGIKTKNVAIALPTSIIIHKKIIVPIFDTEAEMKMHIENEMINQLPNGMAITDVSIDYYVLGKNPESPTDYDVLLIAAKNENIEKKLAAVEAAGLNPVILDVEAYAFQNLVRMMKNDEFNDKTILVVDCSATTLRLLVYRNGDLVFFRDSEIGGNNFNQDLVNNLGVSDTEAEKMKIERLGDETFEMVEKAFLNNYSSEFLRAFQYFTTATSNANIDEIILIGGVAATPGLEESLKNAILDNNETHIRTEPYVARPLQNSVRTSKVNLSKFTRDEPGLFLVTSLALRQFLRQY